ncbi:hypothetical protein [Caulobacter segnis]
MHPDWNTGPLLAFCAALLAGCVAPFVVIYLRQQVRLERLRVLGQFQRTFQDDFAAEKPVKADADRANGETSREEGGYSRSLEFTREKYAAEPSTEPWWRLRSSWQLVWSAIPLIGLCGLGFYTLFSCVGWAAWDQLVGKSWRPILIVGGVAQASDQQVNNILTVAAFAFLGAYAFVLNTLARAVSTFDLSPLTFLRLAVHVAIGVAGAIVLYRAFPDLSEVPVAKVATAHFVGDRTDLPGLWHLTAFVLGLIPDLAINGMISKAQNLQGAKKQDPGLLASTKSISPEVIDGIDYFVRFRLQQANVFEVHHLAVANPIMLFVETPYGIYECIDWVAQAQLCTVVGPERFLALRGVNIRTIFDLERAMLGQGTTSQIRRLIGAIMFSTPPEPSPQSWIFWEKRVTARTGGIASAQFGAFVAELLGETPIDTMARSRDDDPDRSLIHFVRIIIDDLHVHRLRDIWLSLEARLGNSAALKDTLPSS